MARKHRNVFSSTGFSPSPSRKFGGKKYELWIYGKIKRQLERAIKYALNTEKASYRIIKTAGHWAVYVGDK